MNWKQKVPGIVATGLVTLTTGLWTFWGVAEMYYEGWGAPFPRPLAYLIPGAVCILLTLVALTWPRVAGWAVIVIGGGFTAWWWTMQARRGNGLSFGAVLSMFPVSGLLVITGVLFLLEGRYRRRRRAAGLVPHPKWWLRNLHYLVGIGVPLLVIAVTSAVQLPGVLARVDDGDRSALTIEGNGVTLIWAPAGPGWNWKQPWGGFPSWDHIALYGEPPLGMDNKRDRDVHATGADMAATGLCRYLSADGRTLMDERQDIWRLPSADEVVRSLVRRGENAGCMWNSEQDRADCRIKPDKETPLWAPNQEPIYMWTADEDGENEAWYVSYNGWVRSQPKSWGNPRHGYRCVKKP